MNWTALGAIGELFGAIGVMVSIIYLAVQVRQNTASQRASTSQALADSSLAYSSLLGSDPKVALLTARGLAGEPLERAEQAQFVFLYHSFMRVVENGFYQVHNGAMDRDLWLGWTETARVYLGSPGGARMWRSMRPLVRTAFRDYVEEVLLPEASEAASLAFLSSLGIGGPTTGGTVESKPHVSPGTEADSREPDPA